MTEMTDMQLVVKKQAARDLRIREDCFYYNL
jgi:hypothetical protein